MFCFFMQFLFSLAFVGVNCVCPALLSYYHTWVRLRLGAGFACGRPSFHLASRTIVLSPKKKAKTRLGAVPQDPLLIRDLLGIMNVIQLWRTLPCDLLRSLAVG